MEEWINEARLVLERSPTGALPLSSLKDELNRGGIRLGHRGPWLLTALESRPHLFRIVRIPPGPWAPCHGGEGGSEALDDPWIALQSLPNRGYGLGEQVVGRIQEAVQAWGRRLDDGSPSGVARWIRANREGADAGRTVLSPARRCV